jgi:N-acetylmuramoyl-L-alanine amidase
VIDLKENMRQRISTIGIWMAYRLAACTLVLALGASSVWALTPKQQYYRADRAYAQLKKNPGHQKYRDKWLACIDNYHKVERIDPSGPWAAAGLYRSARLYLELHQRSRREADRQEAVNTFRQILQRYPESSYAPKARQQLNGLGAPAAAAPRPPKAPSKMLTSAYAAHERLMASKAKQKYRDQWEGCIARFAAVVAGDPSDAEAAESLYMLGVLYDGLAAKSRRQSDRDTAEEHYRRVQRDFPDSAVAEKAAARLDRQAPAGERKAVATAAAVSGAANPDDDLAVTAAADSPSGMNTVRGLRFWSNPSYTRIVIDADRESRFSHRLLKKDPSIQKPQRLYIDLDRSRLGKGIQKFVPINDELLSDARAGQYTAESVRIVVDIKSFKNYKIFSLKNPFRIVLDVWGQDADLQLAGRAKSPLPTTTGKLPPGAIARQLALGVSRIVIDPGHGGKDYGAPGYLKGVHEKNVVLEIAKRLARKVESELNCDAVLTRTTDRYLTLEERTAIANTQNADLFVSIHTNAVRNSKAYGIETFFLNLATDDDAIRVAARENATSAKNISDLQSILNDLMQNAKINESSRLAAMVQSEMSLHLKNKYDYIRSKGVKQAPFYVLLGAQMPAILVETSFISNPRECKRLNSAAYQEALCDGIIRGIRKYIKETSPTAFMHAPAMAENQG